MNARTLNAICPYFTMFPLDFPLGVLARANPGDVALDPFCGRGTTGFAARLRGLESVSIDSHPLAIALTRAKHASTTPQAILRALDHILETEEPPDSLPPGEFWELAFERGTLTDLMRVRAALNRDCRSEARIGLQAILLGALHGPTTKTIPSYLSNQAPRTYSPKPGYAVRFWKKRNLRPKAVPLREVVKIRAGRYYTTTLPDPEALVIRGDSRDLQVLSSPRKGADVDWIVTSPPYYGLRTYRPDQWLRLWLLGGPPTVDYSQEGQLTHGSPAEFADQLRAVWRNCAEISRAGSKLVVRFGGIADRNADPVVVFRDSLNDTPWRLQTRRDAGSASSGKRQAEHFGVNSSARREYDFWAVMA